MTSKELMDKFKSAVDMIEPHLNKYSMYTIYKSVSIGDLKLDTRDINRNYFVSLENNKNGSGYSNNFSVTIAVNPTEMRDINIIDKAIATAKGEITLEYGYIMLTGEVIKTDPYYGLILDYTTEIRNGLLYYSLTGYSSLVKYKEIKLSIDGAESKKPTEYIMEKVQPELQDYFIVFEEGTLGSDTPIDIGPATDTNIFGYISGLLRSATYSGQSSETPLADKIIYNFYVNDTDKTITIYHIDPKDTNSDTELIFNWMAPQDEGYNDLVIGFQPRFKGALLIATTPKSTTKYIFDENDEIVEAKTREAMPISSESDEMDSAIESSQWAELFQQSYEANLILVGIPSEAPLTGRIRIVPLLNNQKHHTAGTYIILSAIDILDSNGFTTSLKLFRVPDSNIYE